ncbi:MAG TPA: hypothetical protein VGL06_05105 [Pseudonocardiaceae bacterium]
MNGDAVRRYKELADVNTEAVRHMQEHNRQVVEQLLVRLADVELRLAMAIEREQMGRFTVRVNWENAVDMLWPERWLHVGSQPDATTPPPGMDTHQADTEVSRAFDALREALRKPALLPRRQHDD